MSSIFIIFSAITLACPIAIFFLLGDEARKSYIIYYQTLCEIGIVLFLSWYCILNWASAKTTIIPLLLISFLCFTIAEFGFNTTFFQKSLEAYRQKAICAICYSLSFAILTIALINHFKVYNEPFLVILGILSVALVHFSLQYRFLLLPLKDTYFSKLPYFMYINGIAYSIFTAAVAGIAATYCLRSLNVNEFIFLHLLMALLTFDFAARYQIVESTFEKMTVAQYLWALTIGAIFINIVLSYINGKIIFSTEGLLANWFSIRTSLAFFVFVTAIMLTISFWIIRFFSIKNAIDVTLMLIVILSCWGISNILSFNISSRVMEIGFLMGTNKVSEIGIDGSPGLHIHKIQKKIKFSSEINFIIDEYNQIADKFNLRGEKLVESINKRILFEKDAVRGQIANQIAHDIESPLGAIRTMIALPKLDSETARETLSIALTSITDMVSRLDFRTPSPTVSELKIYSASASIEKIVKMKRAEFSGSMINLQLNIAPSALNTFVQIELDAFRSAISNIINNSRDEIIKKGQPGTISINLDVDQSFVLVSVSDDGKTISDNKLEEINNGTCESTKHLAKPLGIISSKEKLSKFDGTLSFSKIDPIGLKATIKLPAQMVPEWHASEICLLDAKKLIIFDDDKAVHQTFKIRLENDPKLANIQLISCHTEKKLSQLISSGEANNALILVDYEFRGSQKTGIQCINDFKINANSILMTSHWDEEKILSDCKLGRIKLLPKSLAHNISITTGPVPRLDFILVDDHPIVGFSWRSAGNSYGLKFKIFSDPIYFEMHKRELNKENLLFLDYHLQGTTGFEVVKNFNGEFPNYYILTGEDKENMPDSPFVDKKRIIFSKNFPTHLFSKSK